MRHPTRPFPLSFLTFPSFAYLRNPSNDIALRAVKSFAADLAARFNPIVGCTRSWDTTNTTEFNVIIDNMMNLEVLFHAADLTGNDTLRQIAISHADKTMMNHVRTDGARSPSMAMWSPFLTAFAQGHRSISLYMMPRPAQSFLGAQCRGTPILAPGVVVRHGASTALRTVRNRTTSAFPQLSFTGHTLAHSVQSHAAGALPAYSSKYGGLFSGQHSFRWSNTMGL
jgi:hypothetical protein